MASLSFAACSAGDGDDIPPGEALRQHPRTIHLTPDGRFITTYLGSGKDDGSVVVSDLSSDGTVVMRDLPSTRDSGQRYADLAGPSGAAMAPDGTVCVVIGDANKPGRGFNTMRCTDGLVVDLKAYEQANNPDGLEVVSNPYDIAWDGKESWLVSDAAANSVLRVTRAGEIAVAAVFPNFAPFVPGEGIPVGLTLVPTDAPDLSGGAVRQPFFPGGVLIALHGGAVAGLEPDGTRNPLMVEGNTPGAIAVFATPDALFVLSHSNADGAEGTGSIATYDGRVVVDGLDRPTGFVRLPDGRFMVAEDTADGRVRIVDPKK